MAASFPASIMINNEWDNVFDKIYKDKIWENHLGVEKKVILMLTFHSVQNPCWFIFGYICMFSVRIFQINHKWFFINFDNAHVKLWNINTKTKI